MNYNERAAAQQKKISEGVNRFGFLPQNFGVNVSFSHSFEENEKAAEKTNQPADTLFYKIALYSQGNVLYYKSKAEDAYKDFVAAIEAFEPVHSDDIYFYFDPPAAKEVNRVLEHLLVTYYWSSIKEVLRKEIKAMEELLDKYETAEREFYEGKINDNSRKD